MVQENTLHNVYQTKINSLIPGTTYAIAFERIKEGDTILEIGCATGYWGEYTKNHKNVEIYGLDYLDYHVEQAKKTNCYKDVIQYDLNKIDDSLDYLEHSFSKIVILDVLEHLYDPPSVLQWCKKMLKPGGQIIISIPNIAHKSIIHQLLLNQFNYTQFGLLDRTHIRFYTATTFQKMLKEQNLEVLKLMKIVNPQSEYEAQLPPEIRNYVNSLPESICFQYVFTVYQND